MYIYVYMYIWVDWYAERREGGGGQTWEGIGVDVEAQKREITHGAKQGPPKKGKESRENIEKTCEGKIKGLGEASFVFCLYLAFLSLNSMSTRDIV